LPGALERDAFLRKYGRKNEKYKVVMKITGMIFLLRDLWEKNSAKKNSEEYQTQDPAEENTTGKKC